MKKILSTIFLLLLSISIGYSQQKDDKKADNEKIYIKIKDDKKPTIYIDGKKFDFPMELIDQSKIESIDVLKGEVALKKYNAPNGVILIKTKISKQIDVTKIKIKKDGELLNDKNAPMIIIDGKVSDKKTLDKLTSDKIEKVEIVKGEKALKKYKAKNGVVLITTKKK